jgi:flagellar biosynthesis chaperone FliJ
MARDPLRVLLAIRQRAVEQARYALAACLTNEAAAKDRISALDAAMQRDRAASGGWQDVLQFHEMSAVRLDVVRAERRTVAANWAAAASLTARARDAVTAARAAAEAVEQLASEQAAARQVEAEKRAQHVLDDIARAMRRRGAAD